MAEHLSGEIRLLLEQLVDRFVVTPQFGGTIQRLARRIGRSRHGANTFVR